MDAVLKNEIVELLKNEGLEIAEESVELLIKGLFKILPVLAAKSTNSFDDMLIPLFPLLEREVLKLVDKIDGEEG